MGGHRPTEDARSVTPPPESLKARLARIKAAKEAAVRQAKK